MTQREANLRYWIARRNSATSFSLWLIAQKQVDSIFVAMGYLRVPLAALVDEKFAFPKVRAQFEAQREVCGCEAGRNGGE
jgi:hypothetical protein